MQNLNKEQLDTLFVRLQSYDPGQSIGQIHEGARDGALYGVDFPVITGDDFTNEQITILQAHDVLYALQEG